jgi:transcriptional regulator with XRE-family HTH domain
MSRAGYQNIEAGRSNPQLSSLRQLADALEVDLASLRGDSGNEAVVARLVGMVRAGVSFPAIIAEVQDKPPREQVEILRRVAAESAIPDVSNQDAR